MKLFTEFVVVGPDAPHPAETAFAPSIWSAERYDSDGDFYYDGIDGRWTMLQLRRDDTVVEVNTFREQRFYDPGTDAVAGLERVLEDVRAGRYAGNTVISGLKDVAVTSLTIQTTSLDDYREFLETVAMFLSHSGGSTIGRFELDAAAFRHDFLDAG